MAKTGDTTNAIVAGLEQIGLDIQALLRAQAREHGLSTLHIRLLIYMHSGPAAPSPGNLARAMRLSKATISVALRSMEQKKLLVRKEVAGDRRSVLLELTEWGQRIAHVAGFCLEPLRRIVAHIGPADKQVLLRNVNGITARLGQVLDEDLA